MSELAHFSIFGMNALELCASTLGLLSVGLTIRRNIWCWPIGAVMVALYVWIFWQAKLYADSALQVVYFFLQLYGWWYWLFGNKAQDETPISHLAPRHLIVMLVAGALVSAATGYLLASYTDQALPYGDATVTVFSLIAQVLMTRKVIEHWLLWVFVNVLACVIYFAKQLYPTTVLYAAFLIMAVFGWQAWRKALAQQSTGSKPLTTEA